jgi:hypothetical protein
MAPDLPNVPTFRGNPDEPEDETPEHCYPVQSCRSAIGHQPYDEYAPQTIFLQLGDALGHSSVVEVGKLARMTKEERVMMTTTSNMLASDMIDDATHLSDPKLILSLEEEFKVWGYLMTQYNLKAGLRKFGVGGKTAAMEEITQLHIMDTWKAMDPTKLSQEERMQALSLLLFLKEKCIGKIKGQACLNGAPQCAYIRKEEAALLTVLTESTSSPQ